MTTSIFATAGQNRNGFYFLFLVVSIFLGAHSAVAQESGSIAEAKKLPSYKMQEPRLAKTESSRSTFLDRIEELDATIAAQHAKPHQTTEESIIAQTGSDQENVSIVQKELAPSFTPNVSGIDVNDLSEILVQTMELENSLKTDFAKKRSQPSSEMEKYIRAKVETLQRIIELMKKKEEILEEMQAIESRQSELDRKIAKR